MSKAWNVVEFGTEVTANPPVLARMTYGKVRTPWRKVGRVSTRLAIRFKSLGGLAVGLEVKPR